MVVIINLPMVAAGTGVIDRRYLVDRCGEARQQDSFEPTDPMISVTPCLSIKRKPL
jgi:hypothetical protein